MVIEFKSKEKWKSERRNVAKNPDPDTETGPQMSVLYFLFECQQFIYYLGPPMLYKFSNRTLGLV